MKNAIVYFCLACLSVILFSCEKYVSSELPKISIKSLSHTEIYKGSELTIYGEGFTVFNSYEVHVGNIVLNAVDGNETSLIVVLPDTISLGSYQVWIAPSFQGGSKFKVQPSDKLQLSVVEDERVVLTSISTPLLKGDVLKISGLGFSTNLASNKIFVGDTELRPTQSSERILECKLPLTIAEGEYSVKVTVIREEGKEYTSEPKTLQIVSKIVSIDALSIPVAKLGQSVLLEGSNISTNKNEVKIKLGDVEIIPIGVTQTSVQFIIPSTIEEGLYELKIVSQEVESNAIPLQVVSGNFVYLTSIDTAGTVVTIKGRGFSSVLSNNTILFNDVEYTPTTATTEQLTFTIPDGFANGEYIVKVKVGEIESLNSKTVFINIPREPEPLPMPVITTSVYDATALTITITGENFGTDPALVAVTVVGTDELNNPNTVTIDSVTETEIILTVDAPLNDDTYTITVTIGENDAVGTFEVTTPTP